MDKKFFISQFQTSTDTTISEASYYLSVAGWDFKKAIAIYVLVTLSDQAYPQKTHSNYSTDYNSFLNNYKSKPNPQQLKHISRLGNTQQDTIIEETIPLDNFVEESIRNSKNELFQKPTNQNQKLRYPLGLSSDEMVTESCSVPFLKSQQEEDCEKISEKEKDDGDGEEIELDLDHEKGIGIGNERKRKNFLPQNQKQKKNNVNGTKISKKKLKRLLNRVPIPSWYDRFEAFKEYDPKLINNWPKGLKNNISITINKQLFDLYCELNTRVQPKNLHRGMTYFFERHGLTNNSKFSRSIMTFSKNILPKKRRVKKGFRKRIIIKSSKKN
ncbi:hypothetical protein M0813_11927 [Anaeramoeba flamelloides]|uniref:Uncharacterized protein n=1 Tax=Anaeramoeba flamelloides TaxID=1746091 RepID=A0AAV8A064_9EUKA|nr:hypothetical protein M0812_08114 [Anaeramoeba flamelloides]KAJ6254879.1 hypothetical protein M0813_11927 [Anaeramoeba flamelloides]